MPEVALASPWVIHTRKIKALFEMDDEVRVESDDECLNVTLYVDNQAKAASLASLIHPEVEFGNVKMTVTVVPPNDEMTVEQNFRVAFEGNPVFAGTAVEAIPGGKSVYALFEPIAVQYESDDISSAYRVDTTTYEQLAKDVLGENDGAFICSDLLPDVIGF